MSGLAFDDFRECREVEVIVGRVVGDIPGSVEEGTKNFGLEIMNSMSAGLAESK